MFFLILLLTWPIAGWFFGFLILKELMDKDGEAMRLYHLFFIAFLGGILGWLAFIGWLEDTRFGRWMDRKLDAFFSIKITKGK